MTATPVDQVVDTFQKWLYLPKPQVLLAVLGAVAANHMQGDPVWLMVVGPPGGGKSEILQAVLGVAHMHPAATITERALLSGTAKREREEGAKGGLLREIGNYGILVCKDFGSLLSMHREERARTLAALREIYDGSWTRHVGVDGGRVLHWTGKVGLIAGVTPTIDRHHAVMGAMGERFVLIRLPHADNAAQARRALAHVGHENQMRSELSDAVRDLFRKAQKQRRQLTIHEQDRLVALATVVVRCRSSVERDSYSREIELVPGSEAPTRLIVVLANLLAGLDAIGVPEDQAWDVVTQTALDSMPRLRHDLMLALYDATDEVDTTALGEQVRHPTTTTRRALEDLTAHYVVERHPQGKGHADLWTLAEWVQKGLGDALRALPDRGVPETSHTPLEAPISSSSSEKYAYDDLTGTPTEKPQNGAIQEELVPAVTSDNEPDWDLP